MAGKPELSYVPPFTGESYATNGQRRIGSTRSGDRRAGTGDRSMSADADDGIVREIGHDEFDPVGTASLIVVYFLILVVMWVFMYFVEFLGRGPTIIG